MRVLARLPAGALSSSVERGLVHFCSVGVSSANKSVWLSIAFIKLVPWRMPRSNSLFLHPLWVLWTAKDPVLFDLPWVFTRVFLPF